MSKWRKKPIVIEAFKWTGGIGQTEDPIWAIDALKKEWGPGAMRFKNKGTPEVEMEIYTLTGPVTAPRGYYICKGIRDEVYPCESGIFEATYEPVE